MKIEIERKFLLKSLPEQKPIEIIKVRQWYLKIDGIWERARLMDSSIGTKRWVHTVKKKISYMSSEEHEREITKKEFNQFVKRCRTIGENSRFIAKERHIYTHGSLKWEVDLFRQKCHIIIAEVEIPSEDYVLQIPEFIERKNLMEVTGMKQFSNKSLSTRIR
jgi:CYTH domain-containing protein